MEEGQLKVSGQEVTELQGKRGGEESEADRRVGGEHGK